MTGTETDTGAVTASVELTLRPGVSVFGERTRVEGSRGTVLLLHDHGADLDQVRAFQVPLQVLGLDTVLLDLPGHGLSDGVWEPDVADAVRAALVECGRDGAAVGVLAVGTAGAALLGLDPGDVAVTVLVAPRLEPALIAAAQAWRTVPLLSMGDPCDAETQRAMDELARRARAWSLRLNVHHLHPEDGQPPSWTAHMTHSGAAFIAEQLAYRALRPPGASSAGPDPSPDAEPPADPSTAGQGQPHG